MANAFTLGGTDMSTLGVVVVRGAMEFLPSMELDIAGIEQLDGGIAGKPFLVPREIEIPVEIEAATRAALGTRLDSIRGVILGNRQKQTLQFDDEVHNDRYWEVLPGAAPIRLTPLGPLAVEGILSFVAPDPIAFDTSEETPSYTINADPKTFNIPTSGSVGGNHDTFPVYVFTINSGAPTQIKIDNTTAGTSLTWAKAIAAGNKVRIKTAPNAMTVELSTDGGTTWSVEMTSLQAASSFPFLKAGVVNAMNVEGLMDATLDLTYRQRWL